MPYLEDGDVQLERRDDENLVLTRYGRFAAREQGMSLAARLLGDVVHDRADLISSLLRKELPWIRWLPDSEQTECIEELMAELVASADTGIFEPFARAVRGWKSTAEVWSDRELADRLKGSFAGEGAGISKPRSKR